MFDEFAKKIQAANGTGGDIFRNYSAYKINAAPEAVTGKKAGAQASIDEANRQNAVDLQKAQYQHDKQMEDDAKDPSKAQMIMKPDHSGYYYLDGNGKQLNINEFSLLTGKRPDELLADSDNPKDQQFVSDYKTMKDLSTAWINGDNATLQKYRAADPDKFNQLVSQYKSPGDMVRGFMSYYSDYYGNGQTPDKRGSFSPQNITAPSKIEEKQLGRTTLDQTLAPTGQAPRQLQGWEKINPFAGQRDELNRWKKKQQDNPWLAYHSALTGR